MASNGYPFGGKGRGRARGKGRGRGRGGPREFKPIPADQIEPLKVYVGNLRLSVTDQVLKSTFAHYVHVVNAFTVKDKNTHRSSGYGFVTVSTPEDVQKLLALKDGDRYIHGQAVTIMPAKKKVILPGDVEYVRSQIAIRDFDLEAPDPEAPCIHLLVDDVLFKIFEMLPLPTLIGVERVCRRWQMLIHKLFVRRTSLSLNREALGLCGPLTRSIVGKLLILSGPTLKQLKVQNVDHSTRQNVLRMIAQLCPELESLDVTQAMGINFSNLRFLTRGCKNLKTFIANKCPGFDDRALKEVLQSYPELERLHIGGWFYEGKDFNILPTTLKELKIPLCHSIEYKHLKLIGDRCPNLEVLDMYQMTVNKELLVHVGENCPELKELKISLVARNFADGLTAFKNLKSLYLEAECEVELFPVIKHMSCLEDLTLRAGSEDIDQNEDFDFSIFKNLKTIALFRLPINKKSLQTLAKCTNLTSLQTHNCSEVTEKILLDILRGCPELGRLWSPNVPLTSEVLKSVNDIMKTRSGPLTLGLSTDTHTFADEIYDKNKIKLDFLSVFHFMMDDDEDDDDDDFESDCDDDSIFSGVSLDKYWMYGFESDSSIPESFFYGDHFELGYFERHLGLFDLNVDDDDDDEYFFD